MKSLNEVLTKVINEEGIDHISTGFIELDRILGGGLRPKIVTLVAGRPSMGKTSFLLDVSVNYTKSTGKKAAFFSFGDGEEFVALSILGKAGENTKEYREFFSPHDLKQKIRKNDPEVKILYDQVKDLPILINWNPGISLFEIKEMCESISQLGLVVIDSSRSFDLGQLTARNLAVLSWMAISLHVPVLCSCNVNRSVEFCEDHRPNLESIMGRVGTVGFPGPTVIALYRDDYYSYEEWEGEVKLPAEAIVIPSAEPRSESNTANLIWNKQFARFENREQTDKEQEKKAFTVGREHKLKEKTEADKLTIEKHYC